MCISCGQWTKVYPPIHLFRLLFVSVWKNIGSVNDGFVTHFLTLANLLLVGTLCLGLYHMKALPNLSTYLVCSGISHREYKIKMESLGPWKVFMKSDKLIESINILQIVSWIFWTAVNCKLKREKRVLEAIQRQPRYGNGLPRHYLVHPGFTHLKKPVVFYSVLIFCNILAALTEYFMLCRL